MIPKLNRFHGYNSLNGVYRKGKVIRGEYISLRYMDSRRDDYRLAVVVSRKVSKSAVKRNRIRRRIFEIVRNYRKELDKPWPYDIVISIFEEKASSIPAEELRSAILKMLQKLN